MNLRFASVWAGWSVLAAGIAAAHPQPELRGVWVTRFEWAAPDADACRSNTTGVFESLAETNFNAAVFQIRGEADTLYPSELEPWSALIGGKDPGFDPVAFAIEEAHRRGITFHAYMNPMPLRSLQWRSPPEDPDHLFHRHGPDSPEPWVCVDREGRPAREEYYYLSAGVPEVHAYLRKVIMDVVRRYDVDGIHLDRIRYPGPEYSFDPISRRRFAGPGNPELLDWQDWQRQQLTKLINDLAAEIRAEKPQVILSCSAWGIYNRHNIPGYGGFSSGYHDYFQDTWNWCRIGAMDVLVPMIYWNLADPKPNYDELVEDFARGVGPEHVAGGQRVFSPDENTRQILLTRKLGACGTVLFSFRSAMRRGVMDHLRGELYSEEAPAPTPARLRAPEFGTIVGTVLADDGQPLVDAAVSMKVPGSDTRSRRRRGASAPTWTSSADGRFAFLNVPPGEARIVVRYEGAATVESDPIAVQAGEVVRVQITVPGSVELRDKPYLAVLRPAEGSTTSRDVVHLLGRALPGNRVTVGGQEVEVFATGGFARDGIPLELGENRIDITVSDERQSLTRSITVTRTEPEPEAPRAGLRIVEPVENVAMRPGDLLQIEAEGPPGRTGRAVLLDADTTLALAEATDRNGRPTGDYAAAIRVPESLGGKRLRVRVVLDETADAPTLEAESRAGVEVWDPAAVRVAETTSEQAGITHGLHSVRLGGPWLAWVPKGTRFEVIRKQGGNCCVRLSASVTGWVDEDEIRWLPAGTPVPHNYFTSCEVNGDDDHDILSIAMNAPVAVAIRPEIEPSNRLYVDFFNTHDAATWISHKARAKILGPIRVEQVETDRVRITVPIASRQIWGYWAEIADGRFTLHVRRPPALAAPPASPFEGLLVAVEAGHGGSNSGALGLFGTQEKTVNYAAAIALQRELESRGARVVQVRQGDESPTLGERVERANAARADLFVSIHANAAGSTRGYLSISGTSTYYHGIHCRPAAQRVYDNLLGLGWGEFGVVGNFSYAPLRNTRMPSILVEQAFMSHPGDEARLLDPAYQRQQAIAVADGLESFLDAVRE